MSHVAGPKQVLLLLAVCLLAGPGCSRPGRHVERITGHDAVFTIHVKGTADHHRMGGWKADPGAAHNPTRYLRISNRGDRPVVNPRVIVEGGPAWFDIDHIIAEFIRPGMSDEEKAFALWQWIRHNLSDGPTFKGPLWGDTRSMTRFMNTFGTGACGTYHIVMPVIGKQAGLETFSGCLADCSHAVQQEFFDGRERYLDAHIPHEKGQPGGWFALKLDNSEIAGAKEIMADRYLIDRAGGGPGRFGYVAYFGPGCSFHKEKDRRDPHKMDLTLRPDESIYFKWAPGDTPWKREMIGRDSDRHGSGGIEFIPRLGKRSIDRDAVKAVNVQTVTCGGRTMITPDDPGDPAEVIYRLHCPYPFTSAGATVGRCDVAADGSIEISRSFDGNSYEEIWRADEAGTTFGTAETREHPRFQEPKFTHDLWYRVTLQGAETAVSGLRLYAAFQAYRPSLPSLSAGRNLIRYESTPGSEQANGSSETPRDRIEVEYRWCDLPDLPVPRAPDRAVHPANGGRFGFNETIRWAPATLAGGGCVDDYEICISSRPDLAWPVMPNTHRMTNSATPSFSLVFPDVLNHGQTYHWRVRGRSHDGVWGEWSDTWSFVAAGPAVPGKPAVSYDPDSGRTTLAWKPPASGTEVDHYEVYASSEHGFSPLRQSETGDILGTIVDRPANLAAITAESRWDASARTELFYRVIAVDADGNRSVPTAIAKAPSPALLPSDLPSAVVGESYRVRLPARLRGGRHALALRKGVIIDGADKPAFVIVDGQRWPWLSIDAATGELSALPPASAIGEHVVTIELANGRSRNCTRPYVLRVKE